MYANLFTFAFLASLAGALQIQPLKNAHTQGDVRVTWISEAEDASRFAAFSVFLHHPTFGSDFAILNNQRSADGGANVTLPAVPVQAGYTLRATDVGDINNEFAASSSFSIGPEASTTSPIASSTPPSFPLRICSRHGLRQRDYSLCPLNISVWHDGLFSNGLLTSRRFRRLKRRRDGERDEYGGAGGRYKLKR